LTIENRQFGKYELIEALGEGGMARVFHAVRSGPMGFRKDVAIKQILPHVAKEEKLVRALVNEARLGGHLHHRNVVEVYEFDQVDDVYYIAMEYVRGFTLDRVLDRIQHQGPLPARIVCLIAMQICTGLAYAHEAEDENDEPMRLVHRDLKPANVMVTSRGVVKIMDFGVAKSQTNLFHTTTASVTKGTPVYMSPEQVNGDPMDARSDLFSLASILAEMITGEVTFEDTQLYHVMRRIARADAEETLEKVRSRIPELLPVLQSAYQRDPDARYASAEEMGKAIQAVCETFSGDEELGPWVQEWMDGEDEGSVGDESVDPDFPNLAGEEVAQASVAKRDVPTTLSGGAIARASAKASVPTEAVPVMPETAEVSDHGVSDHGVSDHGLTGGGYDSWEDEEDEESFGHGDHRAGNRLLIGLALLLVTAVAIVAGVMVFGGMLSEQVADGGTTAVHDGTAGEAATPGEAEPTILGGPVLDTVNYELVRIGAGQFMMGSPESEEGREAGEDQHQVVISRAFWLGTTEVSHGLWNAINNRKPGRRGRDDLPKTNLTWFQAVRFCNALSRAEGLDPVYRIQGKDVSWDRDKDGFRLPTEAEWEYAARAGRTWRFSGTNFVTELCQFANVADATAGKQHPELTLMDCDDGFVAAAPVGSLKPNEWGLYDMTGNVSEWVWDTYAAYPVPGAREARGARQGGIYRISRGGAWTSVPGYLRVANRTRGAPTNRAEYLGFRVARTTSDGDQPSSEVPPSK